jgi:hypothetical protein
MQIASQIRRLTRHFRVTAACGWGRVFAIIGHGCLASAPDDPLGIWAHQAALLSYSEQLATNQAIGPNVLATPATVELFAYNNGVLANGVRTRDIDA